MRYADSPRSLNLLRGVVFGALLSAGVALLFLSLKPGRGLPAARGRKAAGALAPRAGGMARRPFRL
jgi:hypothetical protein